MITKMVTAATLYLADVLPEDVDPDISELPRSEAIKTFLGWALYGAVFACGLAAILSAGFAAWGRVTARPQHMERGLQAFVWAVGCAFLAGIAIPLTNTLFNLDG